MQQHGHESMRRNLDIVERSEIQRKIIAKAKAKAQRFDSIGHLGPDAVVAFVDGEMDRKSSHRVRIHLVHCEECREEVFTQRGTSAWVKQCHNDAEVRAPKDLMAKLAGIAQETTPPEQQRRPQSFVEAALQKTVSQTQPGSALIKKVDKVVRAMRHKDSRG